MLMWEMRRIIMKHHKLQRNVLNYQKQDFYKKHEKNIFWPNKLRFNLEIFSFELEKQFFFINSLHYYEFPMFSFNIKKLTEKTTESLLIIRYCVLTIINFNISYQKYFYVSSLH